MPRKPEPEPLPRLIDCASVARELGVSRAAAEAIMRRVPKQLVPGFRRIYVRRDDVKRFLDENQVDEGGFPLR